MTKKQLSDQEVIHFLESNTDFFVRYADLLETLKVNEKNGTVTSLINHQVNVLKERNAQLKSKLYELISFAEENEKLMSQVFELTLQLSQISHVANVTKHFVRFVKQYFNPDMFKLVMPEYDSLNNSTEVLCIDEQKRGDFNNIFASFFQDNKPLAGRLQKDKLVFIFGQRAPEVGSCVILPIGKNAEKGLLVFAGFDENRFNPEVSTDLLFRLTHILDRKFNKKFPAHNIQKKEINEPD